MGGEEPLGCDEDTGSPAPRQRDSSVFLCGHATRRAGSGVPRPGIEPAPLQWELLVLRVSAAVLGFADFTIPAPGQPLLREAGLAACPFQYDRWPSFTCNRGRRRGKGSRGSGNREGRDRVPTPGHVPGSAAGKKAPSCLARGSRQRTPLPKVLLPGPAPGPLGPTWQ